MAKDPNEPLPTNYIFIKKKRPKWILPVVALVILGAGAAVFFLR